MEDKANGKHVYMRGTLLKRGRGRRTLSRTFKLKFQERYCRLTTRTLEYFESEREMKLPKGMFDTKRIRIVETVDLTAYGTLHPRYHYCFQVGDNSEVLYFATKTEQQRKEWIEALNQVAQDNQNEMLLTYHSGVYHKNRWNCCNKPQRSSSGCTSSLNRRSGLLYSGHLHSHQINLHADQASHFSFPEDNVQTIDVARHTYPGLTREGELFTLNPSESTATMGKTTPQSSIHPYPYIQNGHETPAKHNEDERGMVASKAIQKKSREIVRIIGNKPLEIALALFEEELISDSALEKAANHEIPTDSRAITLMLEIKEAVKVKPSCFHTVCDILGADPLKGDFEKYYREISVSSKSALQVVDFSLGSIRDREATFESEDITAPLTSSLSAFHLHRARYGSMKSIISDPGHSNFTVKPLAALGNQTNTLRYRSISTIHSRHTLAVPELLQDHFVVLTQHLNVEQIRPYLHQYKVLTRDEYIQLLRDDSPNSKAVEHLVVMVESKGSQGFRMFVEALEKTMDQEPAHKDILEELKMDSRFSQIVDA